jgi:uncharacterized membrane protein
MKKQIRKIFFTGLAVSIPIGLTVYILFFIIDLMDGLLGIIPAEIHPDNLLGRHIKGLGVIFTILLIFVVGLITKSYIGNWLIEAGESLLNRIPLVRGIYQSLKQIVDAMMDKDGKGYQGVVLIEFPRQGIFSVAFVTGEAMTELKPKTEERCLNVFIPTTPNPTSGYYLIVAESNVKKLNITVEEAFKLIISGGIVSPSGNELHRQSAKIDA